jgi:hypothetical protein
VYLVLCADWDLPGLWAYRKLREVGLAPIELVTPASLSAAQTWEYRVTRDGIDLNIDLGDGRVLHGANLKGTLNRLMLPPQDLVNRAVVEDREYASGEMGAFYLGWLSALPGVINRPTPHGFPGSWLHASEWAVLAARAGLDTPPYRQSVASRSDEGYLSFVASGTAVTTLVVLRDQVYGSAVSSEVGRACRQLAASAGTDLLGVDLLDAGDGTPTFAHATPLPDLTLGGDDLVNALARTLRGDHS